MTIAALALRLAVSGGRLRLLLVALGCAVGSFVLLLAFAVPGTRPGLSLDEKRLVAVVLVALAVPVLALLASVSRLSAGVRDRRLAALRQLGVSAAATRLAAGLEAGLQALAGVVVGVVLFGALRPSLEAFDRSHRRWFEEHALEPGAWGWAGATVGVVAVCFVVAVLPARQVTRDPLSIGRRASVSRPRPWRLVPLVLGVGLLVYSVARHTDRYATGQHGDTVGAFLVGVVLAATGVPLAAPLLVRGCGDLLVRARRPSLVLAGRRLQQEPAGGARLVATLLTVMFFVVGARCVATAFAATPQAQDARRVAVIGPQYLEFDRAGAASVTTLDAARLASVPGVRDAAVAATGAIGCGSLPVPGATTVEQCALFLVADCGLRAAGTDVAGCDAARPQWLVARGSPAAQIPKTVYLASPGNGSEVLTTVAVTGPIGVLRRDGDERQSYDQVLRIPPGSPLLRTLRHTESARAILYVDADAGAGVRKRIAAAVRPLGLRIASYEDTSEWTIVQGYYDLVDAVGGALFALALLALLVTGVDAAVARRRQLAALARVGVPRRLGTVAQLVQVAVPAVFGSLAAAAAGLLGGAAYLGIGGTASSTPWVAAVVLALAAAAGAVLVALLTGLGTGRVRPADLRHE